MTNSPPATRNPVRQQLDELDALLQRMLALPSNPPAPGPVAVEPRAAPPVSGASEPRPRAQITTILQDGWKQPAMMLLPDSGPVQPPATPEPERWDPSWGINLNPQNGSSILGARSPAAVVDRPAPSAAPPTPAWRSEPVGYALSASPPDPSHSEGPSEPLSAAIIPEPVFRPRFAPRPGPPSLLTVPFVALDQLFDAAVSLVPLGSLFTTRIGKNVVGFAGILMFLGAVTWGVLDFLGWTR
jgi:hypothetical protein